MVPAILGALLELMMEMQSSLVCSTPSLPLTIRSEMAGYRWFTLFKKASKEVMGRCNPHVSSEKGSENEPRVLSDVQQRHHKRTLSSFHNPCDPLLYVQ